MCYAPILVASFAWRELSTDHVQMLLISASISRRKLANGSKDAKLKNNANNQISFF